MIRGTEMAEWKGNERGQLSFVPSWQTAEQLTLETISLCVFLRLTDFNNLPGQSCRYTTLPMPGLCPCLCCATLNSSAFTAFSSSHNGPPPLSLAWYASIPFPLRRWPLVRPCLNQPFYCYCCRLRYVLSHGIQCFLCVKQSSPTTNRVPLGSTGNALIRPDKNVGKIIENIHAWCVILWHHNDLYDINHCSSASLHTDLMSSAWRPDWPSRCGSLRLATRNLLCTT